MCKACDKLLRSWLELSNVTFYAKQEKNSYFLKGRLSPFGIT